MLGTTFNRSLVTTGEKKSLFTALKNFFAGIRDGQQAYVRYQQLSALNDNELKSMGLNRAEIGRAAMFPTDKRAA